MRVVIDSNKLNSPELRTFLAEKPANMAVLTDYAAIESFKGDTLRSVNKSWEVLKDFSDQILVLKGISGASIVDPRGDSVADSFINCEQTRGTRSFSQVLERASSGDLLACEQLRQRGVVADEHIAGIRANSENIEIYISEFASVFSEIELKRMRRNELWHRETEKKFFEVVEGLTGRSLDQHPDKPDLPCVQHLIDHYVFRHSLAQCIYLMELVKKGTVSRKADLVQNDFVDVAFAAFATYFNGFMSTDEAAQTIHRHTRLLLTQRGAQVPPERIF